MRTKTDNSILGFGSWKVINELQSYDNRGFSFDDVKQIQAFLVAGGFMKEIRRNGKPAVDGMLGQETKQAIIDFQRSRGLTPFGDLNKETLKSMDLVVTGKRMPPTGTVNEIPYEEGTLDSDARSITSRPIDTADARGEIIDPIAAKVVFISGFKRLTAQEWIRLGYRNFINLTFFEPDGRPTANFYSAGINLGAKLDSLGRHWPMMMIRPDLRIVERTSMAPSPEDAFSGSHVIVKDGVARKIKQSPSDASMKRRTAVGITESRDVIVMVSPRSDIRGMGEIMKKAGAVDAINMDGGPSSMFVRDGNILIPTSAAVPTILAW